MPDNPAVRAARERVWAAKRAWRAERDAGKAARSAAWRARSALAAERRRMVHALRADGLSVAGISQRVHVSTQRVYEIIGPQRPHPAIGARTRFALDRLRAEGRLVECRPS